MAHPEIERLSRYATLLDSRYRIPGTSIRFGWDAILGLIPGVGDLATAGPATYLIYRSYRLGARRRAIARMAVNVGLDFTLGAVPLIGDVFDVAFKGNRRNIAILEQELARQTVEVLR